MPTYKSPLHRPDTLLGVCQALGDDFGFDPMWLRVPLAVALLWSMSIVIGIYLGLGLLVALSRWLFPNPRPIGAEPAAAEPAPVQAQREEEPLPIAA